MSDIEMEDSRIARRTTVCTPTLLLTRRGNLSVILGWMVFIIFIVIGCFLFVGMWALMRAPIPKYFVTIGVGIISVCWFFSLLGMVILDILSSIDEKVSRQLEYLKRVEGHVYNLYLLSGKKNKSD